MKIDVPLLVGNPAEAAVAAERLESAGCDGLYSFEGPHEPFLPLAIAARHTERALLYPAIAVGFARTPMVIAQVANDLQLLSKGRFALGLGTQIKPHIERRFAMPWSKPVARMREMVRAIHAIWDCWEQGGALDFRGEFYTHTLMPPLFNPGPNPHGRPPLFLAGVGPDMTAMAAAVADGFLIHPLHSERSLRELTQASLDRGLAQSGREARHVQRCCQVMMAVGRDATELRKAREVARAQVAFYSSTPAYKPVLDCMGRGGLQPQLRELTRAGDWAGMASLIDDELLDAVVVSGDPDEAARKLVATRGAVADRLCLSTLSGGVDVLCELLAAVRRTSAPSGD